MTKAAIGIQLFLQYYLPEGEICLVSYFYIVRAISDNISVFRIALDSELSNTKVDINSALIYISLHNVIVVHVSVSIEPRYTKSDDKT